MAEEYRHAECLGNLNDKQPYVVGIPMPSATLYVEHPPDMMNLSPPSDFGALKKKNSFQITSVTVQGSRLNNNNDEFADDSADDLDESHAEDLTSEILDSSKATDFDAEQSDENSNAIYDDLSPCSGPIIIAKLPSNMNEPSINVGLSIGIPPAFPAVGPNAVSSGVTMMTSSATTPVSAQVPIINPLTDHWQHRFKVVKIVSSEPFKRGRWLCMDFMDPPAVQHDVKPEAFDRSENPAALGTQCIINSQVNDVPNDNTVAHVYEIPVNQSYPGSISLAVGDQQQPQPLYGIILPVNNNQPPQVTMVHNIGTQTLLKENVSQQSNQNVVLNNQMAADTPHNVPVPQNQAGLPPSSQTPAVSTAPVQQIPLIPPAQASTVNIPGNPHAPMHSANGNESSFAVPSQVPLPIKNGENVDIMPKPALNVKPPGEVLPEKTFPRTNTTGEDSESSQTASEKTAAADVGRDLDPDCGSAASTGTSTVAIDNKIEQAMDLVKSHLMFAVREEVEVLKEKITELLERISQLEQENDILRANASPETLNQLNQSQNNAQGKSAHSPSQGAPPHSLPQPSSS